MVFGLKQLKQGIYCIRFVKPASSTTVAEVLTRYETPIEYTISSARCLGETKL